VLLRKAYQRFLPDMEFPTWALAVVEWAWPRGFDHAFFRGTALESDSDFQPRRDFDLVTEGVVHAHSFAIFLLRTLPRETVTTRFVDEVKQLEHTATSIEERALANLHPAWNLARATKKYIACLRSELPAAEPSPPQSWWSRLQSVLGNNRATLNRTRAAMHDVNMMPMP